MPQSLSRILVHLIFSSKHREPFIIDPIRPKLHAYLAGILDNLECPSIQTGGVSDHVHLLYLQSRTIKLSEVVEEVKTSSSRWMKTQGVPKFSWQSGYGAFSIGESQVDTVVSYIKKQDAHHQKISFQDEFRRFLKKYKIPYDERYVWD